MIKEYKVLLNDDMMPELHEINCNKWALRDDECDDIVFNIEGMTDLHNCAEEFFWVVSFGCIEGEAKIMQCAHGSHESVNVVLRPLCMFLMLTNSVKCVVLHNHPNNVIEPSEADLKLTKYLQESLEMLDIELLEHLIVGKAGYYQVINEHFVPRKYYDLNDPQYPGID